MRLVRETDPKIFSSRVIPFLNEEKTVNSLMLGIINGVLRGDYDKNEKYFAYTEDNGRLSAAAVMTIPFGPIIYSRKEGMKESLTEFAYDFIGGKYQIDNILGRSEEAKLFAEIFSHLKGIEYKIFMNLRLYELTKTKDIKLSDGIFRKAEMEEKDIIIAMMEEFYRDTGEKMHVDLNIIVEKRIKEGTVFVWDDNGIVSMALKARPLAESASVSGVITPQKLRRRGYATSLVWSLSNFLLELIKGRGRKSNIFV